MSHTIRPMLPADLDAVLRVQAACYPPAMQESGAVVLERLTVAAATCMVACDGDGVCGYLFAYPSRRDCITELGAPFGVAVDADTLYLHDLSVEPRALGRGLARALVAAVLEAGRARDLAYSALVSVQDSAGFWQSLGYRVQASSDPALASYPAGALYMVRAPA